MQKDCKMRVFSIFPIQTRDLFNLSLPRLLARGRGSLHTRSCYMQQHTHTEELAERTRSEVWLNFTRLDMGRAILRMRVNALNILTQLIQNIYYRR